MDRAGASPVVQFGKEEGAPSVKSGKSEDGFFGHCGAGLWYVGLELLTGGQLGCKHDFHGVSHPLEAVFLNGDACYYIPSWRIPINGSFRSLTFTSSSFLPCSSLLIVRFS